MKTNLFDRIQRIKRDYRINKRSLDGLEVPCTKEEIDDLVKEGVLQKGSTWGVQYLGARLVKQV